MATFNYLLLATSFLLQAHLTLLLLQLQLQNRSQLAFSTLGLSLSRSTLDSQMKEQSDPLVRQSEQQRNQIDEEAGMEEEAGQHAWEFCAVGIGVSETRRAQHAERTFCTDDTPATEQSRIVQARPATGRLTDSKAAAAAGAAGASAAAEGLATLGSEAGVSGGGSTVGEPPVASVRGGTGCRGDGGDGCAAAAAADECTSAGSAGKRPAAAPAAAAAETPARGLVRPFRSFAGATALVRDRLASREGRALLRCPSQPLRLPVVVSEALQA